MDRRCKLTSVRMNRRENLVVLGGTILWPLTARANQRGSQRVIALLLVLQEGDPEAPKRVTVFLRSLHKLGWIDGQNVRVDVRYLRSDAARIKVVTREVVEQSPDVIVVNGTQGLVAVRSLTTTIPIVFVSVTNPVDAGFVANVSQPGGNITGFSTFEPEFGGKWLELLKEIAPHVERVGVLYDVLATNFATLWRGIEAAGPVLEFEVEAIHASNPAEITRGIEAFARSPNGGLLVLPTPINSVERKRIVALAAEHRLPATYPFAFYARDGGLIAYGFDVADLFRRAGPYVARILSGDRPGDLPVQAPTKFELLINLNTARALELAVSPSLLARADEVIEE